MRGFEINEINKPNNPHKYNKKTHTHTYIIFTFHVLKNKIDRLKIVF